LRFDQSATTALSALCRGRTRNRIRPRIKVHGLALCGLDPECDVMIEHESGG
jgi:hypothetical protein